MTKTLILFLSTIIAIGILSALLVFTNNFQNSTSDLKSNSKEENQNSASNTDNFKTKIIATGLDTPWSLVILPDNSILITERAGRVRLIDSKQQLISEPVATIKDVVESGEGGLLGITIHPNFASNNYVYLYYTYQVDGENTLNRVTRFTYENSTLNDEEIITDEIPGALFHNGGRIKFGPDKFLYITTGDAQIPSLAQTRTSLAGKILRVTDTGEPAPNNFFRTRVYTYGHRNPQGITWDDSGTLWATEHGNSTQDELNKIESGKNYGWPTIRGDVERTGLVTPLLQSGSNTWAPGGITFYKNSLYFAGLRGNALFKTTIKNDVLSTPEKLFESEFGRIRDVVLGPDNLLYITTSNKDGRGNPTPDDDRVIIINPEQL